MSRDASSTTSDTRDVSTTTTDTTETSTTSSDGGIKGKFSSGKLATLLIVAGVILFIFPEPMTSMAGIVLVLAGVASWALGRFT